MNPNIEWPFNKSTRFTRPPVFCARSDAYDFAVSMSSLNDSASIVQSTTGSACHSRSSVMRNACDTLISLVNGLLYL